MGKINKKLDLDSFVRKSNEIHNNKYDYSLVKYKNMNTKVKLICPIHGVFETYPGNHIHKKSGCRKCAGTKRLTMDEFVHKANKIHDYKYDYSHVNYVNNRTKIEIICPVHGEFLLTPNKHLDRKDGCPKCNRTSKGENLIKWYLEKKHITYETQKRFKNCKDKRTLPFDFWLSDRNMCIEFDGIQHFEVREKFGGEEGFKDRIKKDKIKENFCKENNIYLFRISYKDDIFTKLEEIL